MLLSIRTRSVAGGFDFAADPRQSARDQDVFWSPQANPAVLFVAPTPRSAGPSSAGRIGDLRWRKDLEGQLFAIRQSGGVTTGLIVAADDRETIGAVVIALDAFTDVRIEALIRYWRAECGRPVPRDTRLTVQQRARLRPMMQGFDGRQSGASYRDIAQALYGRERIQSEPWKTSALRERTIRLVRGGRTLVRGGYLGLLR